MTVTVTVMYGTLIKTPPGATEVVLIATMASAVEGGATFNAAGAVGPAGIPVGNTGTPVGNKGSPVESTGGIGMLGGEAAGDVSTTAGEVGV